MPARAKRQPPSPSFEKRRSVPPRRATTPAKAAAAEPSLREQRARVFELTKGFHATHLLAFGHESGAFQQIAHAGPHGISVPELADHAGWSPDYARFFLEAAHALGFVDLASEAGVTPRSRYRFAPHMHELLADDSHPLYIGAVPHYNVLVGEDYRRYPDLFRTGKAYPYALHGEDFLRTAATVTRAIPGRFVADILPRFPALRRRLEQGAHVLDIGCGAGWTIVRFAEDFPKSRVVGIDAEPNAIEMAKTLIAFRQLGQRVEARLVRGEEIDYEAEFDVATLFFVLHGIPPNQKLPALAHARRALKSKGTLLVFDEFYPDAADDFRGADEQLNVVSQWFEGVWGHRFNTRAEHRELLEEAGFRLVNEHVEGRYVALLAEKA